MQVSKKKENLPKGLHSYYEKIEEKPEEHGTLFIIENKRKIFRRKSGFAKLIEKQKKESEKIT